MIDNKIVDILSKKYEIPEFISNQLLNEYKEKFDINIVDNNEQIIEIVDNIYLFFTKDNKYKTEINEYEYGYYLTIFTERYQGTKTEYGSDKSISVLLKMTIEEYRDFLIFNGSSEEPANGFVNFDSYDKAEKANVSLIKLLNLAYITNNLQILS